MKVICPYCHKEAEFVDSSVVYGRSYGMIYNCPPCDARVGVHKGTDKPLGRLADAELRKWKIKAHAAFDPLWRVGDLTRKEAYSWLRRRLNIPKGGCHIGMFDIEMCRKVINEIRIIHDPSQN